MQSFSLKAKTELCRLSVQRHCCSRAESYGVLLYCNTFTTREVRIITENPEFALRLPRLFHTHGLFQGLPFLPRNIA